MLLRVDNWSFNRCRHHECGVVVSAREKEGMMKKGIARLGPLSDAISRFADEKRGRIKMRDKLIVECRAEDGELLQVLEIECPKGTVSDTADHLVKFLDQTFKSLIKEFEVKQ